MDKFERPDIKSETGEGIDRRVVKLDFGSAMQICDYKMHKLQQAGEHDYKSIKARFGPLAATDPDKHARTAGDSKFKINPLMKNALSIEDEEKRVVEERVQARVNELAEATRQAAHQEGHEAGFKKGQEDAFRKFKEDGAASLKTFEKFVQEAEGLKAEIFKANERFLVETIFRIGRMLFLKELAADKEYVTRLARDLIEKTGVRENITVRVSPEDFKTAAKLREDLDKQLGGLRNLNIEESESIRGGGCEIETEWSAIDAGIEKQLAGIHEGLTGVSRTGS
ncbi:MAG: hypothetical protein A2583_02405 [Bdellovibrionales bacterium RIFOXYD1_FULL_53_11]|nr:MAG: hypothetical protein A2583_02405 [Bdellovibrionales bacterium RIFOXYD1_FULL_53_11]